MDGQGLKALTRTREPSSGISSSSSPRRASATSSNRPGANSPFSTWSTPASGLETLKSAIRYFEAASLPAIVQVPSRNIHHIARACDPGAEGLMLPMVGTPDEVRRIIASMKYHPQKGRAGVALQIAHDNYRPGVSSLTSSAAANSIAPPSLCQIRDRRGRQERRCHRGRRWRRPARGSVISILSVSLGIPGEFDDPKFINGGRARWSRRPQAQQGASSVASVPTVEQGIEVNQPGTSISSAIPAMSGCCMTRWPQAIGKLRAGCGKA